MFYQMQDIAWQHAKILGFGFEKLKQDHQFWVLARLLVKIGRRPDWGENFTLETWSRGTDGFFGYRDFNFTDEQGNSIIKATSSWLVINTQSKKIVRLTEFGNFPKYEESVLGTNAEKVKSPKNNTALDYTPVRFNEIDINQHFNTGRYIERITDSFDFDFHQKHELVEYEINFLKEGLPSDLLAVQKQKLDENVYLCSVVRESDKIELVRARLAWRQKK
jgi:acyl-ACP thioesterase